MRGLCIGAAVGIVLLLVGSLDFCRREPVPWELLSSSTRANRFTFWTFGGLEIKNNRIVAKLARYQPKWGEPSERVLGVLVHASGFAENLVSSQDARMAFAMDVMNKRGDPYGRVLMSVRDIRRGFSLAPGHVLDLAAALMGAIVSLSSLVGMLAHIRKAPT